MVISEIVEDEVVLVNFDSGSYYSLAGSGTQVWQALDGGAAPQEVINAVLGQYEGPEADIAVSVRAFLDDLLDEALVVPDGEATSIAEVGLRGSAAFVPPKLERFDDMRDMLLLDPIHEVDEAGWPHTTPPTS